MEQKCNGGCDKAWPKDNGPWHHNFGIETGDGSQNEKGNYKTDYAKMCQECFNNLSDSEKERWPLIK